MRLSRIEFEQFGPFADQQVALRPGLTLLFGRNEAGKSSLLRGIRSALFGAKALRIEGRIPRTLDGWDGARSKTAIRVEGELDSGGIIRFTRTNSTRTPVVGESGGQPLDAAGLETLLGVDAMHYRSIYGFTLEELRAGEQSLVDAHVTEILYGGGLGRLAEFRELQKQIEKRAADQFRARGKNQPINSRLASLQQLETELREKTVTPQEYSTASAEIAAREKSLRQLDATEQSLLDERRKLERSADVAELAEEIRLAKATQSALGVGNVVDESRIAGAVEQLNLIRQFAVAAEELEEEEARVQCDLAEIERVTGLSELANEIDAVVGQVSLVRQTREQLPSLADRVSTLQTRLASFADADVRLPDNAAERLAEWTAESDRLLERRRDVTAALKVAQRQLRELELAGEASIDEQSELQVLALADQFERVDAESHRREALFDELRVQRQTLRELEQQASALVGWTSWPESIPPSPSGTELDAVLAELDETSAAAEEAKLRLDELKRERQRVLDDLDKLAASPLLVTSEQVDAARFERNAAVRVVAEAYVAGELDSRQDKRRASVDAVNRAIEQTDRLADARTANAQEAAREAALRSDLDHLTRDVEAAEALVSSAAESARVVRDQWGERWSDIVSPPPTAVAAREWASRLVEMAVVGDAMVSVQRRFDELEGRREAAETALREIVPEGVRQHDSSARTTWLQNESVAIRERQTERRRVGQQLPQRQLDCEELNEELRVIEREQAALADALTSWFDDVGLKNASTLEDLAEQLQRESQIKETEQQLSATSEEFERASQVVRRFDDAVAALKRPWMRDDVSTEDLVDELGKLLRLDRAAAEREAALQRQQREAEGRRDRLERRKVAAIDAISEIRADRESGESAEEFRLAIEQSGEFWRLEKELRRLNELLNAKAHPFPVDELTVLAGNVDRQSREARLVEIGRELETLRSEQARLADELAVLKNDLESLAQTDRLSELQAEIESERAELRDAIDEYAPLVVLQQMLERAISEFAKSVRPELLDAVAELFRDLTGGDYQAVDRSLEAETMRVQQRDGEWKTPAELSTGTRELLYLAVRLAFTREAAMNGRSLPVVMDDVLVNIDLRRTTFVIRTLMEMSQQIQIVLLSCRPDLGLVFERLGYRDSISELHTNAWADTRRDLLESSPRPAESESATDSNAVTASGSNRPRHRKPAATKKSGRENASRSSNRRAAGNDPPTDSDESLLFDTK